MQKLSTTTFNIKCIETDQENAEPKSEIWLEGVATGRVIAGEYLEAAILWNGCYLILTTDNSPFEEMLDIHLLDLNLKVGDSASIGDMYNTGTFSHLQLSDPNTISLSFIGDARWKFE